MAPEGTPAMSSGNWDLPMPGTPSVPLALTPPALDTAIVLERTRVEVAGRDITNARRELQYSCGGVLVEKAPLRS